MQEVAMRSIVEEALEIPKHRKKKQSSTSNARNKSKHKHIYQDCLFINKDGEQHKGEYCVDCGKIGVINLFETERVSGGYRKILAKEVLRRHKKLEQVEVENFFQKFIVLSGDGE